MNRFRAVKASVTSVSQMLTVIMDTSRTTTVITEFISCGTV